MSSPAIEVSESRQEAPVSRIEVLSTADNATMSPQQARILQQQRELAVRVQSLSSWGWGSAVQECCVTSLDYEKRRLHLTAERVQEQQRQLDEQRRSLLQQQADRNQRIANQERVCASCHGKAVGACFSRVACVTRSGYLMNGKGMSPHHVQHHRIFRHRTPNRLRNKRSCCSSRRKCLPSCARSSRACR